MKPRMNVLNKVGKSLLFPHISVLLILLPIGIIFLVFSMKFIGEQTPIAYASYVLMAYVTTIYCARIPKIIKFFKNLKSKNKYIKRFFDDIHLRVNISLYGAFFLNGAYAVFQLGLGLYHSSFWYYSMAGYYISLAFMRFFLLRHTSKHKPGEKMQTELLRYRACGLVFLVMNLALTLMIFFMVYWNRTFIHHEITTIAMAAYTFTAFTMAIVNMVKYRKYNSPVFSASKAISMAAACVSMITLASTMLTTFDDGTLDLASRKLMLGLLGGAVSAFIIGMAIYMIVQSTKKLGMLNTEVQNEQ